MKSTIRTIAMLAIVAGLASCQEKNNPDGNDSGISEAKLGKVCLTVNIAPPTKVTYTESGNNLQPSWEGGETVILVAEGKTYPLTVKLVGNDATLEGEALKPCTGSLIYYKNAASVTKDADFSDITVDYTNQTGNAEASVFIADNVSISEDGSGKGTLSNAGAIIGITNAKGIPVGAKISKVTVSGAKLSKATVGSGAAFSVADDAAGTLEITPASAPTVGSDNSISPIYIAVPAGENTKIQKITLHTDKGEWSILGSTTVGSGDYLYVKTNLFGALPGKFSVSPTKQVYFSPGNLWADGSDNFYFELAQTHTNNTYQTRASPPPPPEPPVPALDYWHETHVTNFYWSADASEAYVENAPSGGKDSDIFFTNATPNTPNAGFTVNGQQGVWRTLSNEEWQYLFSYADKANDTRAGLYAYCVTVCGSNNCVVLYPDGYSKEKVVGTYDTSSYDTEEEYFAATAEGVVFLPAAGLRTDYSVYDIGSKGSYWASTANGENYAHCLFFDNVVVAPTNYLGYRIYGYSVRLVSDCE